MVIEKSKSILGDCSMNYYLGLDAGTNSIGWACTDSNFELLRNDAGDMWGSHLFT